MCCLRIQVDLDHQDVLERQETQDGTAVLDEMVRMDELGAQAGPVQLVGLSNITKYECGINKRGPTDNRKDPSPVLNRPITYNAHHTEITVCLNLDLFSLCFVKGSLMKMIGQTTIIITTHCDAHQYHMLLLFLVFRLLYLCVIQIYNIMNC